MNYGNWSRTEMNLNFAKMHGLGNDFVVFDQPRDVSDLTGDRIRLLADRRLGVGFDQLLCVQGSGGPRAGYEMRVFNADGSRAEQCGNGVRCVARYLERRGMVSTSEFCIAVGGRSIGVRLEEDGTVSCDMGTPEFEPPRIPLVADARSSRYNLEVGEETVEIGAVSMGNPHAVILVPDVETAPVERLGPALESHPKFPERVNVGFMQIMARDRIRLRVYERGVGETRACGTGACAAAVVGRTCGRLDERVRVELLGGSLDISWIGDSFPVWKRGPATWVFEGTIEV